MGVTCSCEGWSCMVKIPRGSLLALPTKLPKKIVNKQLNFGGVNKQLTTISFGSKLGKECLEVVIEKGNLGGGANKLELSTM